MTVREFIQKLGGPIEAAKFFERTPQAIRNWTYDNAIPWRHHSKIRDFCRRKRIKFNPETPGN